MGVQKHRKPIIAPHYSDYRVGGEGTDSNSLGVESSQVAKDIQGYYGYVTDYYNPNGTNSTQELEADIWADLEPQVYLNFAHLPTGMADLHSLNGGVPQVTAGSTPADYQQLSLAGTDAGSFGRVRVLVRFDPEIDESQLDLRLTFTTNAAAQATGLTEFSIEKQGLVMTQGADIFYSDEALITFFVGDTLEGATVADAGTVRVQARSSVAGTLEVLGVTLDILL